MQNELKPTYEGTYGLAWHKIPTTPGWETCVKLYYVKLETFHPILKWFILACNHLRDVQGTTKAFKQSPDKTHEFIVAAIDPEGYLFEDFDPLVGQDFKIMPPLVLNYQHGGLIDIGAQAVTDKLALEMVDGQQIPDEDTRQHWINSIIAHTKWL